MNFIDGIYCSAHVGNGGLFNLMCNVCLVIIKCCELATVSHCEAAKTVVYSCSLWRTHTASDLRLNLNSKLLKMCATCAAVATACSRAVSSGMHVCLISFFSKERRIEKGPKLKQDADVERARQVETGQQTCDLAWNPRQRALTPLRNSDCSQPDTSTCTIASASLKL